MDVINVVPQQTGGCVASPVPATFGDHAGTPGERFLSHPKLLSAATPRDAIQLAARLGGDLSARPDSRSDDVLLDQSQRCSTPRAPRPPSPTCAGPSAPSSSPSWSATPQSRGWRRRWATARTTQSSCAGWSSSPAGSALTPQHNNQQTCDIDTFMRPKLKAEPSYMGRVFFCRSPSGVVVHGYDVGYPGPEQHTVKQPHNSPAPQGRRALFY